MDSNGFPVQLRVCRLTFRKLARKKSPRRGREGAFETSELVAICFPEVFFAYIDSFYYHYYSYQERIFLICVYSLLFVVFFNESLG
jgi:hypothetical protein